MFFRSEEIKQASTCWICCRRQFLLYSFRRVQTVPILKLLIELLGSKRHTLMHRGWAHNNNHCACRGTVLTAAIPPVTQAQLFLKIGQTVNRVVTPGTLCFFYLCLWIEFGARKKKSPKNRVHLKSNFDKGFKWDTLPLLVLFLSSF